MRVAGYHTGVMGTGEHARQLTAALRTQQIEIEAITLHGTDALEDEALAPGTGAVATDRFADINLLSVNADSTAHTAEQLGPAFFAGRYTIGFWAWEVSTFPTRWNEATRWLDEIWVGSRHVRDAIAPVVDRPVRVIPQPVSLAPSAAEAAPPAGLPGGHRFLFAYDYLSVFARKNPLAVIDAFSRAFAPGAGASLIVKTLNHDRVPEAHERLRTAAAAHPDVHLFEQRLAASERDGLMGAADCYVSLHRAEGFGYTMAEAMWLGKPVIGTGYSGNMDFMSPRNSFPVDYRLVPIGPGAEPYPPDGTWAEPDVAQAARLMRGIVEDPAGAARRGARAAQDIRASHGPEAAGRAMAARLQEILTEPAYADRRRSGSAGRRLLNRLRGRQGPG
ncbi:MAG TPA: glycosyltransferase [Solirubrobacteraceae bacterium]|nr:glycosyltransferase [Solirubrobacteraceae bacterium]